MDGLPPDAFAVVSFHLNQSLSSLFSLDLSLVSQQFLSLEFAQVLDKMAYLTVWQGDDVQRRVKGVVTWFELGENDKNQMLYSMKVCPPLWRTGLRQNFRIFQNEDIESILATILKENGVTEWSPLFSEPHPSREFCVQYGETDYDFLCRMAAEEGIFFYEEHAQKSTDQSLVLCDTVRYLPESFEIPWNPNTRTEVSTLCISQFRYSAQIRPSSVVTKDYTFKRPGWAGRFDQEGQHQDYQRTQYEVYDYPGRFKGAHGQNFARWQMDGWRNNAEVARGTSRSPEIWPGRRMAKRVWRRERDLTGWMSLSRKPEVTWYGWDGDHLTTVQTDTTRIQTVYEPGSFTPLIRIETDNGEREKTQRRSLAEKLQQEGSEDGHGVVFPAELVRMLDRLEGEIRADRVSSESRQWLAQCGLTVERLAAQIEPVYLPERKIHLYHCDHRGLPLALISTEGATEWRGEYDEWGNLLNEENPHHLHQPYRLPGQQHDEESGLYYNRNRYYDPLQGRYITQDPIGLEGGWNLYNYPLNPIIRMDPLGLYNLYQLLYDVWHDDSYGTSSIDITGSGDLISLGGHAGLGVAFAKKKGEMLSDICIYATACGHAGIGGGINAAITYSETKSLPTSGVSNSVGVTVGGGVGGHFAYTYVVDVDNPESSTESVGIGAGVDASVMTLACRTWQECWVN
ncbi:type VI secretion system tip protein VgrG [Escherichia coli]